MLQDAELKYNKLADKVRKMLQAQKDYFSSGRSGQRDTRKLMISKSLEKEVDEMVNPKPRPQAGLFDGEFLGR